jgi:acyl-CoA synthetase (NDP forming)
MNDSLRRLLAPQSVAVIGASDDPARIGGRPIASMLGLGYAGRILPVNPNRRECQGLPAWPSVAELPEVPDVAIVAVAAPQVPDTVRQLGQRGVAAAIVFSAGFAETGEAGAAVQAEAVAAARAHGLRLLGPNALGVVNLHARFVGSFTSMAGLAGFRCGAVSIVSQSGAYGAHLVSTLLDAGIGLAKIVMTGNEADVTLGEVVDALVDDDDTGIIALYSEGIRDGDRLAAALERARRARKPVVMMKVGRSAVGGAAAQSHTASIAGDDAVVDAVLAELGVVRAPTTEAMLDVVKLAGRGIFPPRNTLGVITLSGGAGVIMSDAAEQHGLPVPAMPADAQARMLARLPFCGPRNPVDTTAQFVNDPSLIHPFTEMMLAEGGYRSLAGFMSYAGTNPAFMPILREALGRIREQFPDRLYVLVLRGPREAIEAYESDGFTIFDDPSRAVAAIAAMGRFGDAFEQPDGAAPPALPPFTLPAATPGEAEAKRLLAQLGIASAPERVCTSADEALRAAESFGWPVVLKIASPDILHKSEIGGVLLDVRDAGAVRDGFGTLMQRARTARPDARLDGVLVARQLAGGVECIMGIQRDPVFGPVAMFGLGGIFVEVLHDVVLHRCPFGEDVAERMIRSIRGAPLLLGARGRPVADIAALARMLARLSAFAAAAGPRLRSVDLNPVFALPEGQGAFAADAVIEIDGDAQG